MKVKPDFLITGAGAFLFGIFTASAGWSFYLAAGAGLLAVLIYYSALRSSNRTVEIKVWLRGGLICTFIVLVGFFYYYFYLNFQLENRNIVFEKEIEFSGVVRGEPELKEKFQKLEIELDTPFRGEVSVLVSLSPKFEYGDRLKFLGKIEPAEEARLDPMAYFPKTELVEEHQGFWVKEKLLAFKNRQLSVFRRFLGQDEAALLSGITFGYRGDFNPEFKDQMSRSGTTHIVALSGYNIAILVSSIFFVFNRFFSRRKTFYLTALLIFLFVVMVGGEASVVRAAIMGFLVLLAKEVGRPHDALRIIMLTALGMTLFNPAILRYDLGFQLSFLSLLGLVYLEPTLKRFFRLEKKKPSFLGWRENALTTLSAQLAVAPILIQNFNQFSPTSLLANVLILEVVPLTMFLGFLLATLGSLFNFLGFLTAQLTAVLLFYQIGVIKIFSGLGFNLASLGSGRWLFAIYYLTLIGFIIFKGDDWKKAQS